VASVFVDAGALLSAPHKKTVSNTMVRVADAYLPLKKAGVTKGMMRVLLYLEDLGET
jgi:hypothetical protein